MNTAAPTSLPQTGIGVIVPCDMALDRELWRWTPDDVTLHVTRLAPTPTTISVETVTLMGDTDLVGLGVAELAPVSPAATLYACTSGSFIHGVDGERTLVVSMQAAGAARPVTTSGALVAALEHLEARTIAVATPYDEAITSRLALFMEEAGFRVSRCGHLGLYSNMWQVAYEATADLVRHADSSDADAVVVSCTNLPTYDVIAPLEEEIGKPVISANQASMWATLRMVGRAAVGAGQRLVDNDSRAATPKGRPSRSAARRTKPA